MIWEGRSASSCSNERFGTSTAPRWKPVSAPAKSLARRFANLPISARIAALTAAGLISLIVSSIFLTQALYRSADRTAETKALFDLAAHCGCGTRNLRRIAILADRPVSQLADELPAKCRAGARAADGPSGPPFEIIAGCGQGNPCRDRCLCQDGARGGRQLHSRQPHHRQRTARRGAHPQHQCGCRPEQTRRPSERQGRSRAQRGGETEPRKRRRPLPFWWPSWC